MKTIVSTGEQPEPERPTLTLSGGAGNHTGRTEIHVITTVVDQKGQTQRIAAWFDSDQVLDAITDAVSVARKHRLTEPAAAL